MSFNIMTLGGMAAAIGLIIDDAIVMIEQIERRLHSTWGKGPRRNSRGHLGIPQAAGRFVRRDDHHLCPAGVPHRRDGRILQVAVADARLVAGRVVPRGVFRHSAACALFHDREARPDRRSQWTDFPGRAARLSRDFPGLVAESRRWCCRCSPDFWRSDIWPTPMSVPASCR